MTAQPLPTAASERTVPTVADLMTPNPIVVDAETPLSYVATVLGEHAIGGMPVVDANGAVIGVISETDLVRVQATDDLWARWPGLRARHLMSSPVVSIRAGQPAQDAARLLEAKGIHRLVVVDDEDEATPVGIISSGDLIRGMSHGPLR
jgi:CBS domain-containing protein